MVSSLELNTNRLCTRIQHGECVHAALGEGISRAHNLQSSSAGSYKKVKASSAAAFMTAAAAAAAAAFYTAVIAANTATA